MPGNFDYVKFENSAIASEYSSTSTKALIYATNNNNAYYDLVSGAVTYPKYLELTADSRPLPVASITATDGSALPDSNRICVGASVKGSNSVSFGTKVEYKWEVYSGLSAPTNETSPGSTVFTSSLATPIFGAFNTPGRYTVRYQERDLCCGWSIPVFNVIVVEPQPGTPTATKNPNIDSLCEGETLTLNSPTSPSGGAGTCNVEYRYTTNNGGAWTSWGTTVPSFTSAPGINVIEMRTNCSGLGCDISPSSSYSWYVAQDPQTPSATKSPDAGVVCAGAKLELIDSTIAPGGVGGCNIEYRYTKDSGATWSAWSIIVPRFEAIIGTSIIEMRTNCGGFGCDISGTASFSWLVVADPVISIASNEVICYGNTATITATVSGGTGTNSIQWQSSLTGLAPWSNVGTDSSFYTTDSLTQTTYYRALYSSTGIECGLATSNTIVKEVNDITAGIVAGDQSICSGGDPVAFTEVVTPSASLGTVSYQWQSSTDSGCTIGFTDIAGATSATYDVPAGLTTTTYFRRIDTSNYSGSSCTSTTNCITVTVVPDPTWATDTVYPTIVCLGGSISFSASVSGGLGGSVSWIRATAPGGVGDTVTSADTPTALGTYYYRPVYIPSVSGCDLVDGLETSVLVGDTLAPVFITVADTVVECSVTVIAPTTTDNCAGTLTATTTDSTTYTTQGTRTITWVFDDSSGNTTSVTQNVIVKDTTAPVKPVLADVYGECSATVTAPTTTDNCSGTLTGTTSDSTSYTTQGTRVITWTFDDGNGNTTTATQNVIVKDTTLPTVISVPDVLAACSTTVITPVASDNCIGLVIGTTTNPTTYNTQGTFVITWTFNDGHGNIKTVNQNVTIKDSIAPVLPVITDTIGGCVVTITPPVAQDNCAGPVTATTTDSTTYTVEGTYTIHWTFNDGNGNIAIDSQTVTVRYTQPPTGLANQVRCGDGNVTFTVNDPGVGLTVEWSTDGITNNDGTGISKTKFVAVGAPITEYVRIVTDATGCKSDFISATGTANVIPVLPTGLTDQARCGDGNVTFTVNDPGAGYTIEWSTNGVTNNDGTGLSKIKLVRVGSPVTVYARVSDNITGCKSAFVSASGTANEIPATPVVTNNQTTCGAGDITFTVADPGPGYTVEWSTDGVTNNDGTGLTKVKTIVAGATIVEYVRIRNNITGCTTAFILVTGSSRLTPPLPTGLTDQFRCGDGNVRFFVYDTVSRFTMEWSTDGITNNDGTGATATKFVAVGSPITEYVRVRDNRTGCYSAFISAIGTAVGTPAFPTGLTDQVICRSGRVTFSVNDPGPGFTVQWSTDGRRNNDGTGLQKIKWVNAGSPIVEYVRIVNDNAGCNSEYVSAIGRVKDSLAPQTPVLADISVECSAVVPVPTTSDDCIASVSGTTIDSTVYTSEGVRVIHWNFDDGSGNTTSANQNVNVINCTVTAIINSTTFEDELYQNIPNPFNGTSKITFKLKSKGVIKLALYNSTGQVVKVLAEGYYTPGTYNVFLDASVYPAGSYYYTLQLSSKLLVKKMQIIK